ncbi:MAG: serine/threonine protein kinase [Planctomycetes bacterium]|nr:serine/threonine protein kinase [Planctomycetota bacterium]
MTFAQPFTDYEILDRVGAGAMGTVFKARHKKLNRIVALKVLKPSLARDTRYVDRLRREARIVASLNHPHVVTGYDLGEEGGYHFFVMEYVEGKSLRALLVERGMFPEEYVLRCGQQIAQALDHAYQRGVIHRDVKPGNVLIDEQGNVKLTDMGLAKGPADLTLTRDGATVGTPQYISPEQARNPQDVDVRSDLYSLGATLYHMATGAPPFHGDTMAELITKVLHAAPAPPNEVNPELSSGMSLVLRKLLAKDLRVRYQTPRELLDDFERLRQALPPQVDAERLSQGETDRRPGVLLRALLTVVVALALGAAVWIGTQFRGDPAAPPAPLPFLVELDDDLRELPAPGRRLLHLRAARAAAPAGAELELARRERAAQAQAQAAVDEVAAALRDRGWRELLAWLRDPAVWPDRSLVAQQRVHPALEAATGLLPSQLAEVVRVDRIDALWPELEAELRARDDELLRRFEGHLEGALPAQVEELLRAANFAAADRLWANALQWFDGVRAPPLERLGEATALRARQQRDHGWQRARPAMDAAETLVADALRNQAADSLLHLRERLAAGADPDLVAEAAARLRLDLQQSWPPSARFRAARGLDPWPEVERQFGVFQHAASVAVAEAAARPFERRLDLAWRALCDGSPADGLAVLADLAPPEPRFAAPLAEHRRALQAALAVQEAVLAAIARVGEPVAAFPRAGSGYAVELHVDAGSGRPQLWCRAAGHLARPTSLAEYRCSELVARLKRSGQDPLLGLSREVAQLGSAVWSLVGDELDGLAARLPELGGPFLVDDVWPRILRVRGGRAEVPVDRKGMFARLADAHGAAARGLGPSAEHPLAALRELEAAVLTCRTRVPADDLSDPERQQLRAAQAFLGLLRRRAEAHADIVRAAPAGAGVAVEIAGNEIRAEVVLGATTLARAAQEGWQPRGALLEFAGGDRPWSEVPLQQLQCASGIDAAARTVLQLDVVLPPASVGGRLYFVEFRGAAVALAIGGNDAVHAALVDGDPRREDAARGAFQRAMLGGLSPPRAVAVPGAVHRITFEVRAPLRGRALVKFAFEGTELLAEQCAIETQRPANLVILPRQELGLVAAVVRGSGL